MPDTVAVTLEVDEAAASALTDARTRAAMGRLVSRVLHPQRGPSDLAQAIADAKREARSGGLTDADIDAGLAAYNAERRSAPTQSVAESGSPSTRRDVQRTARRKQWLEENRDAIASFNDWVERHDLPLAEFRRF